MKQIMLYAILMTFNYLTAQDTIVCKTCKYPIYTKSFLTADMHTVNQILNYSYIRKYMGLNPDTMIIVEQKHAMDNYKKVTTVTIEPRFYYLCESIDMFKNRTILYIQILDEWFSMQMVILDSNNYIIERIIINDEVYDEKFSRSKIYKDLSITRVNYIFINNNSTRIQTEFIKFNTSIKKFEVVKTETKDVPFFYYKFKKENIPEDPISMP